MPPPQDRYEVNLELVTIAGTEYAMQADLFHCEDVAELEDDILCFLPTVSDLEVFGCELELLDLREQQPLSEAFRTVLLQRPPGFICLQGWFLKKSLARFLNLFMMISSILLRQKGFSHSSADFLWLLHLVSFFSVVSLA